MGVEPTLDQYTKLVHFLKCHVSKIVVHLHPVGFDTHNVASLFVGPRMLPPWVTVFWHRWLLDFETTVGVEPTCIHEGCSFVASLWRSSSGA